MSLRDWILELRIKALFALARKAERVGNDEVALAHLHRAWTLRKLRSERAANFLESKRLDRVRG